MDTSQETFEFGALEKEMRGSFLNYAMSVIVSRALPDVRDGLKPVHRRILYAMYDLKMLHNRPYLKSARIVGDVLGKYHPHGDSSVYDALVRMSQDFAMRYPVVDGQGNFGSIDGDNAAAMRYTESRMQEYAEYLLSDIDLGTVDFVPNYDNKEEEPVVLPTRIPHLLVNGASGIAVGMATFILPHNLTEVLGGLKALIEDPDITTDALMHHISGPDFPGGGEIHGVSGIRDAYHRGRGSIKVRAKTEIEEDEGSRGKSKIIVTEIPYMVNKARLVERIAELVGDKKVSGISDIRDESSKQGIRVVIECKAGESAQVILNHLFKLTPLQKSYGINTVALVRGVPRLLSLKDLLAEFYAFRREVVLRRTSFLLARAEKRLTLLLGLQVAVENIDEVVQIIRLSSETAGAQQQLMERFKLLEVQAKAILDLRLARLTGLEREKIHNEVKEVHEKIADLKDILSTPQRVTDIILLDIDEVQERFGDKRRTQIFVHPADEITLQSLVEDSPVVVSVSTGGYIKRTATRDIQRQRRGGKGRKGMLVRDDEVTAQIFECTNHQDLLCFTSLGRVYSLKVYRLPEAGLRSRGKHFANLLDLGESERVVAAIPIKSFDLQLNVMCLTRGGFIKKTSLSAFKNIRSIGIYGMVLTSGDQLLEVELCHPTHHVLIASASGRVLRFKATDVRATARMTRGVRAMRLREQSDALVSLEIIDPSDQQLSLLSVCERGYGKRSSIDEYRITRRGGMGVKTIVVNNRNGPLVGVYHLNEHDELVIMTSKGQLLRMGITRLSVIGRNTQGVRLMKIEEEEVIQTVAVIREGAGRNEDTEEPEEPENTRGNSAMTVDDSSSDDRSSEGGGVTLGVGGGSHVSNNDPADGDVGSGVGPDKPAHSTDQD